MTKKRVDLFLKIFIGILCLIPIFSFYLLANNATQQEVEISELLKNDIQVNVRLLSTFTLPFIAFLINYYRKKIQIDIEDTVLMVNYVLFSLTLGLVGYLSFAILLLVLTYAINNVYDFSKIDWQAVSLGKLSAGLIAVIIGAFVAFLHYRVGI